MAKRGGQRLGVGGGAVVATTGGSAAALASGTAILGRGLRDDFYDIPIADDQLVVSNLRITKEEAQAYVEAAGIPKEYLGVIVIRDSEKATGAMSVFVSNEKSLIMQRLFKDNELIVNDYFQIIDKGRYSGTDILMAQVQGAKKHGFKQIETRAEGIGKKYPKPNYNAEELRKMNGYYTWLRLGYVPTWDVVAAHVKGKGEAIARAKGWWGMTKITDIMKTPEGRTFWRDYGSGTNAVFDLTDGSYSMNTLNNYYNAKKQ